MKKAYENQRGNLLLIVSLVIIIISGTYILTTSLIQRIDRDRSGVTNTIDTVYRMESLKSVFEAELKQLILVKKIPVTVNYSGYYKEYYMDFNTLVLSSKDFLEVEKRVMDVMGEDYVDMDMYLNMSSKTVGSFCNTVIEDIYCDSSRSGMLGELILSVDGLQETFDIRVTGLGGGVDKRVDDVFVFNVSSLRVNMKRAEVLQDHYYDGGVRK